MKFIDRMISEVFALLSLPMKEISNYAVENAIMSIKPLLQVANAVELPFDSNLMLYHALPILLIPFQDYYGPRRGQL